MDKIQGPGFTQYDPQYLQVSRRLAPESVKPNVFKEIDEDVAKALLQQDISSLSPEAKEILRKLRKRLAKGESAFVEGKEEDFNELLSNLRLIRESQYEDKDENEDDEERKRRQEKDEERKKKEKLIIPLSGPRPEAKTEVGTPPKPRPSYVGNSQVRELLEAMIVKDTGESQKNAVTRELNILGEKMVSYVKSFGVHIIVLERNSNLTQKRIRGMMIVAPGERSFDGRPWEVVRGIYCQDRRLIVIGEELLGMQFGSAARHEFAHAFDHAFTSRNQRRLPLSVQLWNWFSKERKALPSKYAATNPAEYFAESVDAYFIVEGKSYLERNDPQMFEYLATLFR